MTHTPSPLLQFYQGFGQDSEERSLKEIQQWDFNQLEYVHNYIQWLFPLTDRSHYNLDAPLLKLDDMQSFQSSPKLRQEVLYNLELMLNFYGFIRYSDKIVAANNFDQRIQQWLSFGNHNFLRITRILKSLKLLGLEHEATLFFNALDSIYPQHQSIIGNSYNYWLAAVNDN